MDYTSRAPTVLVANVLLLVLTGILILVRVYVRVFILHSVGLDDVLIWASFAFAFVLCLVTILMTHHGLGLHIQDVSDEDFSKFLLLDFVSALAYIWAFVLAKLSFAVFYFRVIPTKGFRRLNYVIIAVLTAQGIEETAVVCASCTPLYKFWTPTAQGSCLNLTHFYYVSFGIKLLTDLILFIEPIPTLLHLKLPWVKRIGLVIMFSLGLLVCVISIIRATYLNYNGTDNTWSLVDPINWSSAEVCSLVMCACIPYIRNLMAEIPYLNEALGLSSNNHSGGYRTGGGYGGTGSRSGGGGYGSHSYGKDTNSIALQTQRTQRSTNPYIQSRSVVVTHPGGTASANVTSAGGGTNTRVRSTDSTEEIFPNYADRTGGIVVSTDVKVAVEEGRPKSISSLSAESTGGHWNER